MKLTKTMLEQITSIVKSATSTLEARLEARMESEFRRMRIHMQTQVASFPPEIHDTPAQIMRQIEFKYLSPGSCFRLAAGSQPIMKLSPPYAKWEAPMFHDANAYYIRTGSTVRIPDDKFVVPIKVAIHVDDPPRTPSLYRGLT